MELYVFAIIRRQKGDSKIRQRSYCPSYYQNKGIQTYNFGKSKMICMWISVSQINLWSWANYPPKRTASMPINLIEAVIEHPAFFLRTYPTELPIKAALWATEPTPWTAPCSSVRVPDSISLFVDCKAYPLMTADDEKRVPLTITAISIPATIWALIASPSKKGRTTMRKTGRIICFIIFKDAGCTAPP